MVFLNYSTMQMVAKIVYYGPGLCGKTTNLKEIYQKTSPRSRGEMVSLETETDRTLFFDLLPMDVGVVGGFKTKFQLYTVPGQVFYNSTRKLVLRGVDGVVFVADSQSPMLEANKNSYDNLVENLKELGLDIDEVPLVFQFNKRDLPNILTVDVLNQSLNVLGRPYVEAAALQGAGVFETLKEISKQTLVKLKVKADNEFKRSQQQVSLQNDEQKESIKMEIASEALKSPLPSGGDDTVVRKTPGLSGLTHGLGDIPPEEESMPSIVSFEDEDLSFDDEPLGHEKPAPVETERNVVFSVKSNPNGEQRDLGDFDLEFDDDDLVDDSLDLDDFSDLQADGSLAEMAGGFDGDVTLAENRDALIANSELDTNEMDLSALKAEDLDDEFEIEADLEEPILLEDPIFMEEEIPEPGAAPEFAEPLETPTADLGEPVRQPKPVEPSQTPAEAREPEPAPPVSSVPAAKISDPERVKQPEPMKQVVTPKPSPTKKRALSSSLQEIESLATKVIKTKAVKPADMAGSVEELLSGLSVASSGRKIKSEGFRISVPEPFSKAQLNCIFLDEDENVIHTQLIRVKRIKVGEGRYKIKVTLDVNEGASD